MVQELLTTKLHLPPLRENVVRRVQLYDRLTASLNGRLTLVSAPAGFGKSTLVSGWLRETGHPAAWVSLDERDSDQLIAFRIHGVTPDFIGELRKLGFEHPQSEQLLNLRIHGVTPEYIKELQLRGVKNLTVDKLVAMKIHGLD